MASLTKPTSSAKQKDSPPLMSVYLTEDEIDERASGLTPYFTADVVTTTSNLKCYIGTKDQDFLFDPTTYSRTSESNLSVVIYIVRHTRQRRVARRNKTITESYYTLSNLVIPNTYLGVITDKSHDKSHDKKPATYKVGFMSTESPQEFQRIPRPHSTTQFAYSTTHGGNTYYLQPDWDTKSIVAVQATSPAGKYHFSHGSSIVPRSLVANP